MAIFGPKAPFLAIAFWHFNSIFLVEKCNFTYFVNLKFHPGVQCKRLVLPEIMPKEYEKQVLVKIQFWVPFGL